MKQYLIICLLFAVGLYCVSAAVTTYDYNNGGADWTETCSTGQLQSPIDLSNIKGTCDNSVTIDLVLHNSEVSTSVTKDLAGLSSEGEFSVLYAKDINGVLVGYTGTKIQIHTPSEHSVDETSFDLEIQFHHTIKDEFSSALGDTVLPNAIVSLFFNAASTVSSTDSSSTTTTTTVETLTPFFDTWLPSATASFSINPSTAFSTANLAGKYYTYQGSKSQPDCEESVNWYVYADPMYLSSLQLTEIRKYIQGDLTFAKGNGNNRNRQAVNARTIMLGNIACEEQFIYFFSFLILYIFINYFIFKLL